MQSPCLSNETSNIRRKRGRRAGRQHQSERMLKMMRFYEFGSGRRALPWAFVLLIVTAALLPPCGTVQAQTLRTSARDGIAPTPSIRPIPAEVDRSAAAREALREEARAWVADQTRSPMDTIDIGMLDGRVDPSTCTGSYSFDFPFQSKTTVRARCSEPPRQLYIRVGIVALEARLTANRDLPLGHVLSAQDLSTRMVRQSGGGLNDPSAAIGRALVRAVNSGEPIESKDLDEVMVVIRTLVPLAAGDRASTGTTRTETMPRRQAPPGAVPASDAGALSLRRAVPAGHVLQQEDLIDARPVLVARRHMMRGEKLDESMFELVERDRRQIPPDHLTNAEGLEQAELIAPLRAGDTLRTSQLKRSTVVRKGQLVLLTVNRSGIEINVRVEAMEDARVGEQLKMRNPDSGKTLAGIATGQGTARAL
jgi:flagella basal body P-ring formation protein FlgA